MTQFDPGIEEQRFLSTCTKCGKEVECILYDTGNIQCLCRCHYRFWGVPAA